MRDWNEDEGEESAQGARGWRRISLYMYGFVGLCSGQWVCAHHSLYIHVHTCMVAVDVRVRGGDGRTDRRKHAENKEQPETRWMGDKPSAFRGSSRGGGEAEASERLARD